MEIGRIPEIDNSQLNELAKLKKTPEVDDKQKIYDNEQHKKANKDAPVEELNEVIIDNVQFGYNKSSKDFFIKVTRGTAEYRFPTEDMMKIKALLLETVEEIK